MVQPFNQQPNENNTELDSDNLNPLGIKNPLFPAHSLGQTTLQMQVLRPLRQTSIVGLKNTVKPSPIELNDASETIQSKPSVNLQREPTNQSQKENNLILSSENKIQLKQETSSDELTSRGSKAENLNARDFEINVEQVVKQNNIPQTVPIVLENLVQPSLLNDFNHLNSKSLISSKFKNKDQFRRDKSSLTKTNERAQKIYRKNEKINNQLSEDREKETAIAHSIRPQEIINRTPDDTLQSSYSLTRTNNEQDIPAAWSSIADLIEKNTVVESSMPIQRSSHEELSPDKSEDLIFTPEGFQLTRNNASTSQNNQSANSLIQPKRDRNTNSRSPSGKTILQTKKSYSSQGNFADITGTNYNENDFLDEQLSLGIKNYPKEDYTKTFEELAREIYNLLRQKLEIYRERHGRRSSSRLPW